MAKSPETEAEPEPETAAPADPAAATEPEPAESEPAQSELEPEPGAEPAAGPEALEPEPDPAEPKPAPASAEPDLVAEAPAETIAATAGPAADDSDTDDELYRSLWFFDNPSLGRAIRYTFAEKRLARAVFVNSLFLVVTLAVIQELFGRNQLGLFSERISFGRIAFLGMVSIEAVLLAILAPLGAINLFEAERREECFDQVVASGADPHRVVFGRYLATLAFLSVVLFSSLPFLLTAVVLDGASLADVVTAYAVLASFALAASAVGLALAVALDDVALPILVSIGAVVVTLVVGLTRQGDPVFAALSPIRHVVLTQADIARDLRLGNLIGPDPFGVEVSCALLSIAFYLVATGLALAYAYVGPDLELTQGLDSFDSVSISPKVEATRARRGIAKALLRSVQLRFFYENLSPGARAWSPLVRALVTVSLFAVGHALTLSAVWPSSSTQSLAKINRQTVFPYVLFCLVSLGLLALLAASARSALFAKVSVLRLGPARVGRFASLFGIFALALLVPPVLWQTAGSLTALPPEVLYSATTRQLYFLAAGYSAFVFALALLFSMATTNPYSATGGTLLVLFATNLIPAIWVPLFTGNVIGEGSAFLLDLSPFAAAFEIAKPDGSLPFTRYVDDKPQTFSYEPSLGPFLWSHLLLGLGVLTAALVLAQRQLTALRERLAREQSQ